jgi:hypothetical protein
MSPLLEHGADPFIVARSLAQTYRNTASIIVAVGILASMLPTASVFGTIEAITSSFLIKGKGVDGKLMKCKQE